MSSAATSDGTAWCGASVFPRAEPHAGHRPTSTSAPGGAHHDLDEAVRGHERRLDEDAGRPLRGELLRPDLLDGASMLQVRDVDDGLSDVGPGEPGGRERAPHA